MPSTTLWILPYIVNARISAPRTPVGFAIYPYPAKLIYLNLPRPTTLLKITHICLI